ncbi:MAG: molybdopterin-dependent oxidoreductase [Actinomycetota bacterium]|nr:molybdopterin-dependent oxidoreductase [Actinomycetota bacterium]
MQSPDTQPTRRFGDLAAAGAAGIASVGAGVAAAHLLASLLAPAGSPLVAVGGTFIDLTPAWLKEFAISTFGTADKAVLLGGIAATLVLVAALCGVLARRSRAAGCAAVALVALVGAVAALTRPAASAIDAVPSLAGAVVAAAVLSWLTRPVPPALMAASGGGAPGTAPTRRSVLVGSLAVAGGAVAVAALGSAIGGRLRDVSAARASVRLPAPSEPATALADAVDVRIDGVTPFRVPNDDFYRVDTALVVPAIDPSGWRLDIGGMVQRPYSLSYDELLAMPLVERDLTLTCVSNEVGGPYVGNALWLGVRLSDLLARAGVDRGADQLFSRSADGWTASTPMGAVTDGRDALVAVAMNGEPLPAEHGFPARMIVPGLYGFVSATKWLVWLEATTYAQRAAYWTERGWATDAPVRTMARIEVPRPLSTVAPGAIAIAGVCWAQHRGIEWVEVQVDDEPWVAARLGAAPSIDTWRQWWIPWYATSGRHVLRVRATDATGEVQPQARLTPFPSGAQGWHEVVVNVG